MLSVIMMIALNILIQMEETKGTNLFYTGTIPFFATGVPPAFSH